MLRIVLAACLAAGLSACGGGGSGGDGISFAQPSVTVSGLQSGQSLVVTLNGNLDSLNIVTNGKRAFSEKIASSERYTLAITTLTNGATCRFTSGATAFNGRNAGRDTPRIQCGVPTDPGEGGGDDGPGGTGTLRHLGSLTHSPFIVSSALRVVNPVTGVAYTGSLVESDFEVLINGAPTGEAEDTLYLDAAAEVDKVVHIYVDVSSSMEPFMPAIRNAIIALQGQIDDDINERIKLHWFDESIVQIVTYSNDWADFAAVVNNTYPPRGGMVPGTNVFGALQVASSIVRRDISPVHMTTGHAVLITDGYHTVSDGSEAGDIAEQIKGSPLTVVAYGPDVNLPLLQQVSSNVKTAASAAQLTAILSEVITDLRNETAGVRLLHYATPLRTGDHELSVRLTRGDLCVAGEGCTFTIPFSANSFSARRGTLGMVSEPSPYEHQFVKLKVFPWIDEFLGCQLAPGGYQWTLDPSNSTHALIDVSDSYKLIYFLDQSNVTVKVSANSGEACSYEFELSPSERPQFED